MIKTKTISSLEKCFWDENIDSKKEIKRISMMKNERMSFQIAYTPDENADINGAEKIYFRIESELSDCIKVFRIMNVPCNLPASKNTSDDNYLRKTPGLYPDLLIPWNSDLPLYLPYSQLCSLWIEINSPLKAGNYDIVYSFVYKNEIISENTVSVKVIDAELPKQDIIYTQWFYADCLRDYYRTGEFDDEHFRIIENYMRSAYEHGMNMIFTPVFTPALDTEVGMERTTVQLVKIYRDNGKYSFDFTNLGKWIKIALSIGYEYFEISHFFTQWGVKAAPKVMATVDGEYKRIFGWDTPSNCDEYSEFLRVFIPELITYLKNQGVDKKCKFHISDEPRAKSISDYMNARNIVADALNGYDIMDALSDYDFYKMGIVDVPVPSTREVENFINNGVKDVWTYYCCTAESKLSNHFIAMPSSRNRCLAMQLYKYDIKGFLHWGFNFWNCVHSLYHINPFLSTDGDYFSPAGDHTVVYPAPDGTPYSSIRQKVFADVLTDVRAFKLCEMLYSKDYVMNILESDSRNINFRLTDYSSEYISEYREKINDAIDKAIR